MVAVVADATPVVVGVPGGAAAAPVGAGEAGTVADGDEGVGCGW